MKSAPFDYILPKSLDEASLALGQTAVSAIAIAGGQSLVPMLNLRVAMPDVVVEISRLPELAETAQTPSDFLIGASTTHADIEDGKIPDPFKSLMRKIASKISYRAVRNLGTIGGSVALADPAADWPVCLLALGASIRIVSRSGKRTEPIADFIRGQYSTSLAKDEIITGIQIPSRTPDIRWGAFKVVRKSGAFANSIAVIVERKSEGKVTAALGAASDRPFLLKKTASKLETGKRSEEELRGAIAADLEGHLPVDDTYLWRLHTSTVLHAAREMLKQ